VEEVLDDDEEEEEGRFRFDGRDADDCFGRERR
jgi:hypothetical protein